MAEASNGQTVTQDMAKDALEYRAQVQPPAIEQYGRFHHALTSARYSLYAFADEDSEEHDADLMEFVRHTDPKTWDDARNSIESLLGLLRTYVAEYYPDEVVWTLDHDADVEVDL